MMCLAWLMNHENCREEATQYGVLTPQLASASHWSTVLILTSDWLKLTPALLVTM